MWTRKNKRKELTDLNPVFVVEAAIRQAIEKDDRKAFLSSAAAFFAVPADQREDGHHVLRLILSVDYGRDAYFEHKSWRDNTLAAELNTPVDFGGNALYELVKSEGGRKALVADVGLVRKVRPEGFCLAGGVGFYPAYYYLSSEQGLKLLAMQPDLCACLTVEVLNSIRPNADVPHVYTMAQSKAGIDVLSSPCLRGKIKAQGLQFSVKHESTLLHLSRRKKGLILFHHHKLADNVDKKTLNRVDSLGESPALNFLKSAEGQQALILHTGLRHKISKETFKRITYDNVSALYYLAKSKVHGPLLLANDKRLVKYITKEALNSICRKGNYLGATSFYWLLSSFRGRQFLEAHPEICNMVTMDTLSITIQGVDDSKNSVIKLLARPDCFEVLKIMPAEIRRKVVGNVPTLDKSKYQLALREDSTVYLKKNPRQVDEDVIKPCYYAKVVKLDLH